MDKKKFVDFIESVAEVKHLKPATSPTMRLDETHQNDVKVGDEWIHINKDSNPTLGLKFVKLKPQHRLCELGCGDIVSNQVVEKRLATHPKPHWRTRCTNCECFVSPDGEGFIKGGHQIQAAYMRYFKGLPIREESGTAQVGQTLDDEIKRFERSAPSKWTTDSQGNIRLKEGE